MAAGHPPTTPAWLDPLGSGIRRQFAAGAMISRPDPDDNRLFRIERGSARICLAADQRELTLGCLKPGSIYVTHTRAWVEALEPVELTSWPVSALTAVLTESPELAISALREVGMMLHQAINLIEDLAFRPVEARFARYLLLEQDNQQSANIQLAGSTELLASLLGTSRQTLSSLINRLIRDGVVARPDRFHLAILDQSTLQLLAAGGAGAPVSAS